MVPWVSIIERFHCIQIEYHTSTTMSLYCLSVQLDVIMDMLGNPKMRHIITENYQHSREPRCVRRAIITAR